MNDTRYTAIAAALREEFPKANNGTVSMALHTNDYGVKFCARAQEIYDAVRSASLAYRAGLSPYGYSAG